MYLKEPTNQTELGILGVITYCSKFIPQFATLTDPLRQLLRKNAAWIWKEDHQKSFSNLKSALMSSTTLAYFNPLSETEVITDASPITSL